MKNMVRLKLYGTEVPCKDCKERELGCHCSCERYIRFKAAVEQEREAQKLEYIKNDYGRPLPRRRRGGAS